MAKIVVDTFKGILPKVADDKLPDGFAQTARNLVLDTGEARALRKPSSIIALSDSSYKTLFEYLESSTSHWVAFDTDVDWVRSPIANDSFERVYFTGFSDYRAFANDLNSGPWDQAVDFYNPNIPEGTSPTVSDAVAGGVDYRMYYYTYVSRYGEEGPASLMSNELTTVADGNTVKVSDIEYPSEGQLITPTGTADVNRPKQRVYRTATDGAGLTAFLLVCEAEWFDVAHTYVVGDYVFTDDSGSGTYDLWICTVGGVGTWAAGTHTFTEGEAVSDANLGSANQSAFYDGLPANSEGLIGHPNGFLVAFNGNEILFSEPYNPHAWPTDYAIPIDQEIIALGQFGSTVVVATDGNVYTFTGAHPTAMYKKKLGFFPCSNKRGMVSTERGAMFPSSTGFIMVKDGELKNVTEEWFRPEDLEDYELEDMHGTWYQGTYYGFFKTVDAEGGLFLDLTHGNATDTVDYHWAGYISLVDGEFKTIFPSSIAAPSTLYIAQWEGDDENYLDGTFFSKKFIVNQVKTFNVARVIIDTDFVTSVLATIEDNQTLQNLNNSLFSASLNGCLNGAANNAYAVDGDTLFSISSLGINAYNEFKIYVDGTLKFTKQVSDSKFFKLPRGFQDKKWEFKVSGYIPTKRVEMATSLKELLN